MRGASWALLVLSASLTQASVVEREQVTLGALSDAAHGVFEAEVLGVEPTRVRLEVGAVLKGQVPQALWLPRGEAELAWAVGERWLVFAAHDGASWRPLASGWQRIAGGGPAYAAAVRSRLPRLDGGDGALQAALCDQLGAPEPRIAVDAALDLLRFRDLTLSGGELGLVQRAVDARPSPELFALCARLGHPGLGASVLRAARQLPAGDAALRPAAAALSAGDATGAIQALAGDLHGAELDALRAVELLGGMGAQAHPELGAGLGDPRPAVRAATIRALARSGVALSGAQASALLVRVREGDAQERRLALAALTRVGPAAFVRAVAREHPDPETRALAERLRRDPSALARRILGE
ncbi:MAG: hypothetical protein R3F62_02290 [Planctomycetota bacterium]